MKRWQIFLLGFISLALIGGAGYLGYRGEIQNPFTSKQAQPTAVVEPPTVEVSRGDVKQTIINPGQLVNYKTIDLPAETSGPITEVNVRPGNSVKAGDVLVRFGNRVQLESEVAQAELDLLNAQQTLDELYQNHGSQLADAESKLVEAQKSADEASRNRTWMDYPRASDLALENAETKYLLAKEAHKEAQKEYNKWANKHLTHPKRVLALQNLVAAKQKMDLAMANWNWLILPPSESEFAKADTDLVAAEAELELAQIEYNALKGGVDPNKLARADVDLNKAELDLALAEAKLAALELTAPFDGVILEVNVNVGQTISEGANLIMITDPKALEVATSVVEEDYPLLTVSQPVELYFDAAPDEIATGRVDRIIPKRVSNDRPLYQIYISIDKVPDAVVEGMTADAAIILAQKNNVLRLPRALVQAKADGTATVSIWMKDHTEERDITVGLRGDTFIEILSGLEEGEQVVGQ